MVRMLHAPLGFQPQGAMLAEIDLSEVEPKGDAPLEKTKAMIDMLRSIPGVTATGTVNRVCFTGGLRGIPVFPPGTTKFTLNNSVLAPYGLRYRRATSRLPAPGSCVAGMFHGVTPQIRRMWRL
jgi:hypothetical protein